MKREPVVWGYNWATLALGDIQGSGPPGWELEARRADLLCKHIIIIAKSKEVEPGCNLAESYKEGMPQKVAVLLLLLLLMFLRDSSNFRSSKYLYAAASL